MNSTAQLIQWTDQTWGAVANVLGGGTSINGGLYIEEEPDFFEDGKAVLFFGWGLRKIDSARPDN